MTESNPSLKRVHGSLLRTLFLLLLVPLAAGGCKIHVGEGDKAWNAFVDPDRHDADMGGYDLHYIDTGKGPAVILIHGYADSTYCWHENVRPLLDAGFRTVLVDQPGLGRSGIPPKPYVYSVENQSEEILKLADRLGLERFFVAGSSMGGGICLYLGLHHPDRVLGAAVFDPACFRPPSHGLHRLLGVPVLGRIADWFKGRWVLRAQLREVYWEDGKVDDVLVDEYARAMNKPGMLPVLGALSDEYFSEAFDRMTGSYENMRIPLLIVWGARDPWIPVEFGERLRDRVQGSRLVVIQESGHLPHQENPQAVNPVFVGFLRDVMESKN